MIPSTPYEYLKEHLGCMWSIAHRETHQRKWSIYSKKKPGEPIPELLKLSDLWNGRINCCQQLPTEIILESDYKDAEQYKNKENEDYAEALLQKYRVGYMVTSHKGKSDYIWFRFKTSQPITPKLRLEIIRHLSKPGLNFDEGFKSLKYVRAVPGRLHWKHSSQIEKVLKVVQGEDLDIDKIGIKVPVNQIPAKAGSITYSFKEREPKGFARSLSIVGISKNYNFQDCPFCSTKFIFNDDLGWFRCNKCNIKGGIKKFLILILNKKKGVTA